MDGMKDAVTVGFGLIRWAGGWRRGRRSCFWTRGRIKATRRERERENGRSFAFEKSPGIRPQLFRLLSTLDYLSFEKEKMENCIPLYLLKVSSPLHAILFIYVFVNIQISKLPFSQ